VFFSFPILKNYANWFEVAAEVFEHYFSIWYVAGLLYLRTKFCWAVYNPYYIIHADTSINWQDVEIYTICSQYSFLTIGASSYEQISLILTPVSANHGLLPVKKQWCNLPGLQYMVFSFFKCWYCVLKCNVCGKGRKELHVLSPKSEGHVVQCWTRPEVFKVHSQWSEIGPYWFKIRGCTRKLFDVHLILHFNVAHVMY